MNNADWMKRDLAAVWHPCSQMKDHETLPLIPIKQGKGVWLEDFDGNKYIDAVSSWWVNILGHSNPRINDRVKNQLDTLEHAILGGFTHEAVVTLSERLVEMTPEGLDKCFYADNGSSAIEVAMKMSYHYWLNHGKPDKSKFITLDNSYHGETLGALSVGRVELYRETYRPFLIETFSVPSPDSFNREKGESEADFAIRIFAEMEKALEQHHEEVCAVIVEPLVQCAGNMRMYDPVYLTMLRKACDKYNVHLIADEVAVGFGRTGTLFACEQASITPDYMCLSKALTGGYLPLSVVLTRNEIYDAFYDDYTNLTMFLHSHSYTGNALACSAALATLDILEEDNVIENNRELSAYMYQSIAHLEDHPNIVDIRQTGMILAMEMGQKDGTPFDWKERRGMRVFRHGLENQALLRPLGNVVYFMPPYVISKSEIDMLAKVATDGIEIATKS